MNRIELVIEIAKSTGIPADKSNEILKAIIDATTQALKKGDDVYLHGFGRFSTSKRPARTYYHLKTKEPYKVKEKNTVRFKASSVLSDKIQAALTTQVSDAAVNDPAKS